LAITLTFVCSASSIDKWVKSVSDWHQWVTIRPTTVRSVLELLDGNTRAAIAALTPVVAKVDAPLPALADLNEYKGSFLFRQEYDYLKSKGSQEFDRWAWKERWVYDTQSPDMLMWAEGMFIAMKVTFPNRLARVLSGPYEGAAPLIHMTGIENDQFYTTDFEEQTRFMMGEYQVRRCVGFVFKTPQPGTVPLYQVWQDSPRRHVLTLDEEKWLDDGWREHGVIGHVYP
jgi:hypothetical protein